MRNNAPDSMQNQQENDLLSQIDPSDTSLKASAQRLG
jgi:hypothetical protein